MGELTAPEENQKSLGASLLVKQALLKAGVGVDATVA
jgi:hypothetical protein